MKTVFFSAQPYDKAFFTQFNKDNHELVFIDIPLSEQTADLAAGAEAVCVFVNDKVTAAVIQKLAAGNTKIIALRCAGFNNVDLEAAKAAGINVCRVPAYSPEAVAEHAVAMSVSYTHLTLPTNREV